jgi:hypothetical protein
VGDVVTEILGKPVSEESNQQLAKLAPGDTIELKVRSRGSQHELRWKVAGRQEISYQVRDLDRVTPEHGARRAAWLKGEAESSTPTGTRAP